MKKVKTILAMLFCSLMCAQDTREVPQLEPPTEFIKDGNGKTWRLNWYRDYFRDGTLFRQYDYVDGHYNHLEWECMLIKEEPPINII